jgi:hypothetical protein
MEGIDLHREADRLRVASRIFDYADALHRRRHGPSGYEDYESYRGWLRDEFSYRCVFSLIRETWIGKASAFDIDHLKPQTGSPDLRCDYDNLLYLTHRLNLKKGKRPLVDPCRVALGKCLRVEPEGDQMGEIFSLNQIGQKIINVLRLDSDDATEERKKWLRILRSVARTDEDWFRKLIGYPSELPNLRRATPKGNSRREGIESSAQVLRDEQKRLPGWY